MGLPYAPILIEAQQMSSHRGKGNVSMKPQARRLPLTSVAVVLAIFVLSAALLGVNLIQLPFGFLAHIEQDEIDDIITAAVVVIAAFVVDRVVAARSLRHETHLQTERLRVVKVTMRTMQ